MALQSLMGIPGLGGYLGMEQYRQQQALGNLQGQVGLMNAVRQQQAAEQEAQMAPYDIQHKQALVGQANAVAQERQAAQAFQQKLPELINSVTGEDGTVDYGRLSGLLIGTPGGARMGLDLRKAEEDRLARVEAQKQNYLIRQQQLIDRRAAEEREARNDAERIAARSRYEQGLIDLRREMASSRGGGGDVRREPFTFSVNGRNIQGWRTRDGKVYTSSGQEVTNYAPQISTADQKAEQEKREALAAGQVVESNLARMEEIMLGPIDPKTGQRISDKASPSSVAGLTSPLVRGMEYFTAQRGGERPGLEFDQLIESTLNSAQKAGKLSNQQKNELMAMFATGLRGDPGSVMRGIELMRQYAGIRGANAAAPVGRERPRPGSGYVPPPPPGFKVD